MKTYQTEGRRMIVEFLLKNAENQYTIEEILEKLSMSGGKDVPGRSSVYRLINKMVEEGSVRRFVRENSRHFYYQLVDGQECKVHLHMKCLACSRLYHLNDDVTASVTSLLLESDNFMLDPEKTTFFGICSQCEKT